MKDVGYTLFDTEVGRCGIAWNENGIVAVRLPETDDEKTRAGLLRRVPGARESEPPTEIARAIEAIQSLLRGERTDLSGVRVDLDGMPEFNRKIYAIAREIPPGRTLTYGDIAKQLGDPLLSRAVGQAMGQNPVPVVVPCHRVVAAGGKSGGFSAPGGSQTKLKMLMIERAKFGSAPDLFDVIDRD
jgi:methylated-DNA-[protein]-cysteine S-methyltransferase